MPKTITYAFKPQCEPVQDNINKSINKYIKSFWYIYLKCEQGNCHRHSLNNPNDDVSNNSLIL